MNNLRLEPATFEDAQFIRQWRNHPSISKQMINTNLVQEQEHNDWLDKILTSDSEYLLVAKDVGEPIGIIRLSIDNQIRSGEWAFYAKPESKKGTGAILEFLALDFAFLKIGLTHLNCKVLNTNIEVISLHKKFGFLNNGSSNISDGRILQHFVTTSDSWNHKREALSILIDRLRGMIK